MTDKLVQYIHQNEDIYLEMLKKACRQPSVSTTGEGMDKMPALVEEFLSSVGARTERLETSGYPIIYGEINEGAARTLTFYNHYDVQPVDPIDEWISDPFGAEVRDGRLFARGAADNKGNVVARICAVHAYQQVYGKLPVNIKFIFEGEEEVGSPHLKEFPQKWPEKLKTDGILWEGGSKDVNGPLHVSLGVKGMCYVELVARGANSDLHSLNAAIVENPAWRLVWALNTLKNEKEEILIEGFYDRIPEPSAQDMKFLQQMTFDEKTKLENFGLDQFLLGLSGTELKEKYLYKPTCNICGFSSGYAGKGGKTVLPSKASVKMDLRLVPDQDPDEIAGLLRKHLDKHGFEDIEVMIHSKKPPYRSNPEDALVKAVLDNVEQVYGMPPIVYRNIAGTCAISDLCKNDRIPVVMIGVGNEDARIHSPNENVFIDDYINGIKIVSTIIHKFNNYN